MKPYRNRKMLDAAQYVPCIRCGKEGETRACHYNGMYQISFGKGRGQKCSDFATAEFCHDCDQLFSEGSTPFGKDICGKAMRSDELQRYIILTNIRRIERGIKF